LVLIAGQKYKYLLTNNKFLKIKGKYFLIKSFSLKNFLRRFRSVPLPGMPGIVKHFLKLFLLWKW
jgi:hypothetical protein